LFTFDARRVVLDGADADPLGVHALAFRGLEMAVLLIIVLITIGLSVRAGLYGRVWRIAESEAEDSGWLIETCARTFVLVLLSLLGLLALGVLYGNVLGAANMSNP
jgi:hypothetical protein